MIINRLLFTKDKNMTKAVKLDIGCGKNKVSEDFIGLDIKKPADIVMDVSEKKLPFGNESVDEIYSSHLLEHVENPVFVLKEIYRVLKKDGMLTLQYPHFTDYRAHNQYHRFFLSGAILDFYDEKSRVMVSKKLEDARFKIIKKQIMVHKTLLLPYTYIIAEIAKFAPDFYEKFFCYLAPAYNVRIFCKKVV
ncbi:MAG: class I SAM-dependent methyltransferase [Candidatus Omnitrophica bacterium]|nr:class I SAM-dependent methyltransferase [Candidatus Omnitrophota bacterium]